MDGAHHPAPDRVLAAELLDREACPERWRGWFTEPADTPTVEFPVVPWVRKGSEVGDTYNITIRRDGGKTEHHSTRDAAEGRRSLINAEQDPSVTEYDVNGDMGYRRDDR